MASACNIFGFFGANICLGFISRSILCVRDTAVFVADSSCRLYAAIVDRLKFGLPKRQRLMDAVNLCLAALLIMDVWQLDLWQNPSTNPLAVFSDETFHKYGVSLGDFDMTKFYAAIQSWKQLGTTGTIFLYLTR